MTSLLNPCSSADGCLFQISNQVTLGVSEEETVAKLVQITERLIEQERTLRRKMYEADREALTDRIMSPLCALGCCIFVGWVWKPESIIAEVEQSGFRFRLAKAYTVLIRFVAPAAILAILILSIFSGVTLS